MYLPPFVSELRYATHSPAVMEMDGVASNTTFSTRETSLSTALFVKFSLPFWVVSFRGFKTNVAEGMLRPAHLYFSSVPVPKVAGVESFLYHIAVSSR